MPHTYPNRQPLDRCGGIRWPVPPPHPPTPELPNMRWYLGEERPPRPTRPAPGQKLTDAEWLNLWLHSTPSVSTALFTEGPTPTGPLTEDERDRVEAYLRTHRGPAGHAL